MLKKYLNYKLNEEGESTLEHVVWFLAVLVIISAIVCLWLWLVLTYTLWGVTLAVVLAALTIYLDYLRLRDKL